MLVFSRRIGQEFVVRRGGEELVILLLGTRKGAMKVGITGAKGAFEVVRSELIERDAAETAKAPER